MKISHIAFTLAALIASNGAFAQAVDVSAHLDDCTVLTGKKYSKEFKFYFGAIQGKAKAGSVSDKYLVAAIANNKFVCFEEKLNPETQWTVQTETKGSSVVETQSPVAFAVSKNAEALAALRDAVAAMKAAAEYSPDYGVIASQLMVRFKDVFTAELPEAYTYASQAKAIYCRYEKPASIKQNWGFLCTNAKSLVKQLTPVLSAELRENLDDNAGLWAEMFAEKQKYKSAKR